MSSGKQSKEEIFRQQVIAAAQQLLDKFGLEKVTMEDVAKAVGKGRSSLYYYYKSREEILEAVMNAEVNEILDEIEKAISRESSVENKIHAFCETKIKGLRKKRVLYNAIHKWITIEGIINHFETISSIRKRYLKLESEILNSILTSGIEKGELHPLNKKAQDMLVFVLISGLHGLEKEIEIEKDHSAWLEPAIDALSNMIIHGLK